MLIRTHYTGASMSTEFAPIRNKLSRVPYPLCTGYMGTGAVEAVGGDVSDSALGDKVYFRGNNAGGMARLDGTAVSRVSGAHCSYIVAKPDMSHGVAKLIPGAPMDVAVSFAMPAVGLYGVDMANPRMGQTVVVHGVGLIGLGVVAACAHLGCVVVAVDLNAKRLAVARELGADHVIDASSSDVGTEVRALASEGADVVFECTGLPQCIDPAIALCCQHGSFVWQGNYSAAPLSMHFLPPHGRRLRMFSSCDDGMQPCRRAVVKSMAIGTLKREETITHRIDCTEAPAMYAQINAGETDALGVTIRWTEEAT